MPLPSNKFCPEHKDCDTPVMAAKDLQKASKDDLNAYRKKDAAKDARDDDLFVIESLLE